MSDGEFQLTEPWSAKILAKLVDEAQNSKYCFPKSSGKTFLKIGAETL